jgi:hypothetical protein
VRTAKECIERADRLLGGLRQFDSDINEAERDLILVTAKEAQTNIDLARYLREEALYHPWLVLKDPDDPTPRRI